MQYEYDVCLSFAGEQRNYVKQVYLELVENNIRVFYDQNEDLETLLWGRNLIDLFKDIYRDKAKFCVMFLSKEYAAKAWIRHERHSALSRALHEYDAYILPVRFDDTDISGLDDSISYLDATVKTPVQIAHSIIKKLDPQFTDTIQTVPEALHSLFQSLLAKVKDRQSEIVLIEAEDNIKIFKNKKDALEEAYGAFICCIKAGAQPEYKLIDINFSHNNQEQPKKSEDILHYIDEALNNE